MWGEQRAHQENNGIEKRVETGDVLLGNGISRWSAIHINTLVFPLTTQSSPFYFFLGVWNLNFIHCAASGLKTLFTSKQKPLLCLTRNWGEPGILNKNFFCDNENFSCLLWNAMHWNLEPIPCNVATSGMRMHYRGIL